MVGKLFAVGRVLAAGLMAATLASATANAGKLEDIQKAGVIRVGVGLTGEPIGFRDGNNNPVGYDVDVAQRLAELAGRKIADHGGVGRGPHHHASIGPDRRGRLQYDRDVGARAGGGFFDHLPEIGHQVADARWNWREVDGRSSKAKVA